METEMPSEEAELKGTRMRRKEETVPSDEEEK